MIKGNVKYVDWETRAVVSYALCPLLCIPTWYYVTRCKFEVKKNHFAMVANYSTGKKKTVLYGTGFHILGRYNKLLGIYSFT